VAIEVTSGPWHVDEIERWLQETLIPVRLATSGIRGPLVQSLWYFFEDGALWCATQRESVVAQRVRRDSRVGWEISPDQPPYRGVRGQGTVEIVDDSRRAEEVLCKLIDRYGQSGTDLEAWLLGRVSTEIALRITDLTATSWDFSRRMADR
jgi:general stress protein 26